MNRWKINAEPWFQAWLILTPIVGFGSYFLARSLWRRMQAMLQRKTQSLWEAPPIPELTEPTSIAGYAIAASILFSFFWLIVARLYIRAQTTQATGSEQ